MAVMHELFGEIGVKMGRQSIDFRSIEEAKE
jgi:hypothetical protein